jgi:choline dehydrogenase-like flavoprotein
MKHREFEYVFVGSGVAASTVAKTILESDRLASILVLDAGPKVPAKDRRSWWDYVVLDRRPYDYCYDKKGENQSVGKTEWSFDDGRVMMFGGSTVHWGGWCLRFKPEDFEVFSRTGEAADWPISYQTLEPYYCRAEEYLSVCGDDSEGWTERSKPYPLPPFPWTAADCEMIGAFNKLGIKPGKLPIARYRKCMTTGTCKYCPFGARFSGQIALEDLLSDGRHVNLEVLHDAPAVRINAKSKKLIDSVEYLDARTGEHYEAHAKTIVVCAGAYETPKLLQLSTSDYWKNGIGNDHDIVGRYISSHPFLIVRGRMDHNKEEWFQEYDFPTLMSRTYDSPELQKDGGKIFLFKDRTQPNVDIAAQMIQGLPREEVDRAVQSTRTQELQAFMDDRGQFENRVSIGRGKNRFGLPQTQIDFTRLPEFYVTIEKRLALMEQVIVAMGYTVDPKNRKIRTQSAHHMTSTCRMGKGPEDGVVDENLRVHGTDNLYVCSNAVFPTGSAVNPTLTLTAMSMRLGDHLNAGGA